MSVFGLNFSGKSNYRRNMDWYCTRATDIEEFLVVEGYHIRFAVKCYLSVNQDMGSSIKRKGIWFDQFTYVCICVVHHLISAFPFCFSTNICLQFEIFNELARIFSEENNAWAQREVLMREGTAKFADTTGENDRHMQKVFQKQVCHSRSHYLLQWNPCKSIPFYSNKKKKTCVEYAYQSWHNPILGHIPNGSNHDPCGNTWHYRPE